MRKFWETVEYNIVEKDLEFIQMLRQNLNGKIVFKGFEFQENDTFDWYCRRFALNQIKFETYFLCSAKVLAEFGATTRFAPSADLKPINETYINGDLASLLYDGGSCASAFQGSIKDSKTLAQQFCHELFEEQYSQNFVICLKSETAWNSWFSDFMYDYTWLIICLQTRIVWMLAYTDLDSRILSSLG